MADDPTTNGADGDDRHEVDSVMAEEVEPTPAPSRPSAPPQSETSPGLFVAQDGESNAPTPAPPMTSDQANDAMKEYQRTIAEQLRTAIAQDPTEADNSAESNAKTKKDPAADEFARLKAKYERKKADKSLKIDDEIKFLKAESAENARLRKMQQDKEYDNPTFEDSEPADEEDELFVSEVPELPDLSDFESDEEDKPKKRGRKGKRPAGDDDDGDEPPSKRAKKSASGGKKSRKVAGQDYSNAELDEVLNAVKSGKKKKKQQPPPKKAAKSKPAPKKKAKAKGGPDMTNLDSIWGGNVFRDAEANEDLPNQPGFQGDFSRKKGQRSDAMKQLIASVPTESRDTAKYDQKYLDAAIKDFTGTGSVKAAPDGNWYVRGMQTTLKHYQILGTAFMRRRETGGDNPRGGIMADGMGLGKTLMTLANIVNGRPAKNKSKLKTTLIVASPALVNQWYQEIMEHCTSRSKSKEHGMGRVIKHIAGHRIDSNMAMDVLQDAEIILTTYGEVMRSYPKADVPEDLVTATQKDNWWREHYEKNKGILHQVKFLRVVLDEAQQIKNHKTRGSMSCRALQARHYWALTGTPILNGVSEFYSLFKFLREPHTGSFKLFKHNFCDKSDPDSLEKLNVFLRKLMVRRTHLDTLFGAKLLELPKPHETDLYLEFSEIERQVYEIVKVRMINKINSISKQEGAQGLQKKFSNIWTMILRLRQLCGHVLLIQGTIMDFLEREDFEKLNRISESEDDMSEEGAAILTHLKRVLSSRNGTTSVDATNGATISEAQVIATGTVDIGDIDGDVGHSHGLAFRFKRYLRELARSERWKEITDRSCCVACRQRAQDPYISDCFHIYCYQCLTDIQHLAARRGKDSARCVECGKQYTDARPCDGLEELADQTASPSPTDTRTTAPKKNQKKKNASNDDWIDLPSGVLPSAKSRATKAQILVWLEEDPDAKIIIYTQFIPMVKILEKMCQTERWEYNKYTGNMSQDARDRSINEFGKKPEKKILLASLKAGGLGLNLTMASRVLLLDPWWNSAVEQQAFARVYRIGQVRETQLTRLTVTNTIDSAMMAVKKRKDEDIEAVMNDSRRKETLNVKDLMSLFGDVREDGEGKPFIFAQGADCYDEDEPEHLRVPAGDEDDEDAFMGNEE